MALKILFLTPYPPGESPSQRFRFEQYFALLQEKHIRFTCQSFLSSASWRIFYSPGNWFKKIAVLLLGFFRRFAILLKVPQYDFVFIHREASPMGPPIFEWIIANLLKKKIIYDFDDAIWLPDNPNESLMRSTIKWRWKVRNIIHWSYKVSCGNLYLCDYAYRYNHNVYLNPTTIDTESLHNRNLYPPIEKKGIVIGWTGTHSTLQYLDTIKDVLVQLENKHPDVTIMIIADASPDLGLKRMQFLPWKAATEIPDLCNFDIGIMPLRDDEWARGKCGFKALQYMALGIPAIVSPVGVNTTIIEDGVNGLIADTPEQWMTSIEKLLSDQSLRRSIGATGRDTVVRNYSVRSNSSNFLSLFM